MAGTAWSRGARIANAHVAVTPSDTESNATALPGSTVALYIGVTGDVTAEMWGSTAEVKYESVPAGAYLEGNFRYVKATGTAASDIVALYTV
jgi:hypothetical protein